MGLYQTRGPPVHARVYLTCTTKIQKHFACKTTTPTISTHVPQIWTMNTICTTCQQCHTPQQTTNKGNPRSDENISIQCKSNQQHNADSTQYYCNRISRTDDHNNEKYKTVSGLSSYKLQSVDQIQSNIVLAVHSNASYLNETQA